jgi:tetratricopeptide (TPR) repeat protein
MKNLTLTLIALVFSLTLSAQSETEAQLEELYYQNQYDKIISKYADKKDELSAVSLYYVGRAYYMKDQEDLCIAFMDLSIAKDSAYASAYYIKGYSLHYKNKDREAVACFNKAIALEPDNYRYYTGLGDMYYYLDKYPKALEAYQKAMLLPECSERAFFITGVIYLEQNEPDKALQSLFAAKAKAEADKDAYADILFNLGHTWILKKDYTQAEATYNELLSVKPDDYHAYAKLMQVYYHNGEYDRATPLRKTLYDAHENGKLRNTPVEDMFCYDQFSWQGYDVMAYERYQQGQRRVAYDKQLFYIIPEGQEKSVLTIVLEYVPGSDQNGDTLYELCARKGSLKFKSGVTVTAKEAYEQLKTKVLKVAGEHLE